ncbi:DUF6286 domain-containing protein [Amycolatopsis suaedae]|uniref:DUF6286 domain-containing protein n=1 Tax=Amycolatopsis suaedae TaxID=2510978 RepID=A0A4Q7JBE5_9PSEU|nr:DUF6286 domain-containing protein [Amycolatopsis suaedae]RZQ64609.1 hypothetical protein EWH70_06820 [Amycolatopsis suaedae]
MKRRPRRRVPSTLTALALLAACVVVAAVAIQLILGQPQWIDYDRVATTLHGLRWNDPLTAVAGGLLALLGLVLLLAAVLPGRLIVIPLDGDPDSGASRRGYRNTLRAAAAVDGVSALKLRVRRRRIKAVVRTNRGTTAGLDEAVRAGLERRLDQIRPSTRPALTVNVRSTRKPS